MTDLSVWSEEETRPRRRRRKKKSGRGKAALAVVLSLATGPHRVAEPGWRRSTAERIALAEQWLSQG